ncbi:MAG TPA: hypothetical protein VFE62_26620 [Gemmataceae bacterium]|nr:hypothetical protein [Gemmataceae bacterium]
MRNLILPIPPMPIRRRLLDAVEAMRLACARLGEAIEDFPDLPAKMTEHIDDGDLYAWRAAIMIFVGMFEEVIGGACPTVPDRVFATIATHVNGDAGPVWSPACQIPHAEGAVLAIELASQSIKAALDASARVNGDTCDRLDDAMLAAREMLDMTAGFLSSGFIDNILAGMLEHEAVCV